MDSQAAVKQAEVQTRSSYVVKIERLLWTYTEVPVKVRPDRARL